MTNLNYSLVGANGDTITFDYETYVLNKGMRGQGIPATQVRIDESAGPGGIWRFSKRGVREIDLVVTILGVDRAEVEYRLRRLARLIQDTSGPTQLVADYDDGRSLSLDVHYTTGAESQWGEDEGLTWCKWVLSFKAPQPYWESTTSQTFRITSGSTGRGLLPQLSKLKVSSSQSLGTVNVSNSADVPCYPTWTITGPITGLEINNGTQGFTFTQPVTAGQIITVDTALGTVTASNGANLYYILGPAPKLFPFPPGNTTIEVLGTGTTSQTAIACNYALQYEVVH